MRVWLLVGVALARKGEEPAVVGPDYAAMEAEQCDREVPENYQIHTGFAVNDDATEAIVQARLLARREALESLCSGKSESRCAVIRRHLEDWKQPFHNPLTGKACAHVGVNRQWIDDDLREQEAMATALRSLAAEAALRVGGQPVVLPTPVWGESGCDAGEVGDVVLSELRGALADGATRIVPAGTKPSSTVRVVAKVTGDAVFLDASVQRTGTTGELPLKGVSFARDLLAVEEASRDCRVDSALGLPAGHRAGADGLQVWLDLGKSGTVCEGDRGEPTVVVSAPAKVKVWSVDKSGTALLVWPPPGQEGRVDSRITLGEMIFYPSPSGGEERLVAAAVPLGKSFATIDAWTGFCRHPGELDLAAWPTAAATAVALAVHRYDEPVCIQRGVGATPPQPMPPIPTCPQRLGG